MKPPASGATPSTPPRPPPEAWARVRLFAMDVDGILTDGSVFIGSDGTEAKQFSVLDGLGLARARRAGVILAWISGRESGATTRRAQELAIPHLVQGRPDKSVALEELAVRTGVPLAAMCYMGDDEIDVEAMRIAGIGVTVPEAMPAALAVADHVTQRGGGRGAVREVCDLILAARTNGETSGATPAPA